MTKLQEAKLIKLLTPLVKKVLNEMELRISKDIYRKMERYLAPIYKKMGDPTLFAKEASPISIPNKKHAFLWTGYQEMCEDGGNGKNGMPGREWEKLIADNFGWLPDSDQERVLTQIAKNAGVL